MSPGLEVQAFATQGGPGPEVDEARLLVRYRQVRARSLSLAAPLSAEDQQAQSMPDASPVKWHLAHTTWFFETFLLAEAADHQPFDAAFGFLFNSYYEALGERQPRPQRGLITRPSAAEVRAYRAHVDLGMERLLSAKPLDAERRDRIRLGLAHEEQHQELILTDLLHLFAQSPLRPAYDDEAADPAPDPGALEFAAFAGGLVEIGRDADQPGGDAFAFDNEGPRHTVFLHPHRLARRLTTNREWIAFIDAGGYRRPEFWLSEGWAAVQAEDWRAPFYWEERDGGWHVMTLNGLRPVDPNAPATHVSYYEADAFARFSGRRLPTEAEWEAAAEQGQLDQLYDLGWQWTASAYAPYPGFRPAAGAVGEYNGKFMVSQMVLRGGSRATPAGHSRSSYRNFFPPGARWQFSSVRLADDAAARSRTPPAPLATATFRSDVLKGLSGAQKSLPSKYFYDAEGSRLFEAICDLEEYYPTRTEMALLAAVAPEIAARIPEGAVLVEYGSGASLKTRLLLDAARLSAYVPIDISPAALAPAAEAVAEAYPGLKVVPVLGDFVHDFDLPDDLGDAPRVGFFPGSTIGNFAPDEAVDLLRRARLSLGSGALFLLGADIAKDRETLEAAYDDAKGVTAAFNLNLLARINRELKGDLDLDRFEHRALWNADDHRVEMHLVSKAAQRVTVAGRSFDFAEGETIHTENAHKLTPEHWIQLAEQAGWRPVAHWLSPTPQFGLFLLQA